MRFQPNAICSRREQDAAAVQLVAAVALLNAQEAEAAEAAFRAVLAVEPDWAPALEGLGRALYDQHRFDEAEAIFEQATEYDL